MTYPTYAQLMQTYAAMKDMLELREAEVQFKQGIIDESLAYIAELEEFRTKANDRIRRLSDALEEIVYRYESRKMCNCEPDGHYVCDCCLAKRALEGKL